ncbi:YbaB/EbfC family nucleoid-associated protein [Nonomuraea guangzhouensis]|uniref:YbaB/EbfC family nucleoid-associated protein n=1 Tax=Nonomuraea guangzhouensis TaxID=1291555 RepID=A0ABW4GI53_9ACTN|nr:YbaB/EbfC family nucleoid-associated protein [Nonomuraea guangzhouensis]
MDSSDPRLDELDRLVQASERTMRELEEATRELRQLTGSGESRGGTVSARVDADSKLVEVRITHRAMRLEPEELGHDVVEAVRAAQEDHERQARELLGLQPVGEDLLGTFKRDLDELQDAYARETGERLEGMRRTQRSWED